ncbi:SCO3242 family prenyltransferase [Saccharopolyspora sp. NPDC047091]|uniref:SCO3242 family prenyltransferase n=1 Tax=Saccharopolyspora sp. NPDC047091 TaxID=3155924 RepID=UPI0033D924DA
MSRWIRLLRAPAALTAWADPVVGSVAAGRSFQGRRWLLPASAAAFYWAGMVLNDWADRDEDAVERPERPIPSGEIAAEHAIAAATGLLTAGVGLAALGGGRDAVHVAVLLGATVCAYDLVLKNTPAAPVGMGACRALNVLLGAGWSGTRAAAFEAGLVAAHTVGITALSRGEVHGAARGIAVAALGGTVAVGTAVVASPAPFARHRVQASAAGLVYAGFVGSHQLRAVRSPVAPAVRSATAAGIHGMIALQSALVARRGAGAVAVVIAAALPLARRLGKKVSPT